MFIPLVFTTYIMEPSNVPRFLVVTIILFGFLINSWIKKKDLLFTSPALLILWICFYVWNLISVTWTFNKADAFYECQKVVCVPLLFLFFINNIKSDEDEHQLVKAFIGITLLYLGYAGFDLIQLPDFNFETLYSIQSFSEHKNLLASFLFLLMVFPIYAIVFFTRTWKVVSLIVLFLQIFLLLFLQVRSVYLAMIATSVVLLVSRFKDLNIIRKKIISLALVGSVLGILVFVSLPYAANRLTIKSYTSGSANERLQVWSNTLSLIGDHPVVGVGAGNWQYNFMRYGISDIPNISRNDVSFQRPHNDFLWILSETGSIGFALILCVIVLVFKKAYPEIKHGNTKVLLFFAFLMGLLVESFFSFPKERITHIALAALLLVLLLRNAGSVQPLKIARKWIFISGLIVLCFSLWIGYCRVVGERNTVLLLSEKRNNNPRGTLNFGNKAISTFYVTDPGSTPIYSYMGWAYNILNNRDSLLYVSAQAYKISPYDFEVLSNYGYALSLKGNTVEAEKMLNESLRINRYYEPALLNKVVLAYNSKKYKEALIYLSEIPDYESKYSVYLEKIKKKLNSL